MSGTETGTTGVESATWNPGDHDPVCAALSHDEEDSCSCGLFDDE